MEKEALNNQEDIEIEILDYFEEAEEERNFVRVRGHRFSVPEYGFALGCTWVPKYEGN